nr:hypothetical protein [Streptomyces sp. 846.5]
MFVIQHRHPPEATSLRPDPDNPAAAVQRTASGHWDAARAAIATGLDVEPTAEQLYRD